MMKIWCKIFGHKWGPGKYQQDCERKNCLARRNLVMKRFPDIGESLYDWEIIDIGSIKFK